MYILLGLHVYIVRLTCIYGSSQLLQPYRQIKEYANIDNAIFRYVTFVWLLIALVY